MLHAEKTEEKHEDLLTSVTFATVSPMYFVSIQEIL
jgi:hypothetical protein